MQLSTSIDTGLKLKELGGLYVSFDGNKPKTLSNVLKDVDGHDEVNKSRIVLDETFDYIQFQRILCS